jgi:thymidine phosphorylase
MAKLDGFHAPIAQDGQPRKKYKKTGKAAVQKKVTAQKKAATVSEISAEDTVQVASKEGGPSHSDGEKMKGSGGVKVTPPLPIPII